MNYTKTKSRKTIWSFPEENGDECVVKAIWGRIFIIYLAVGSVLELKLLIKYTNGLFKFLNYKDKTYFFQKLVT